jgi:hypothetical protein
MNHRQIEQFDIIDRYLLGKLLAEEARSFEEHFVDCPQCVARLQMTKNFLQDLRHVAASEAWQHEPRRAARGFRPLWQTLARRPFAVVAGCLLIVAVAAAVYVINYTHRLRAEAAQATRLAEQWQGRYEDERQSAAAADLRRQEAESQQAEQVRALEARLKDEQALRAAMAADGYRQTPTGGDLPTFLLEAVRGADANASEKVVTVPRSAPVFALTMGLEDGETYEKYRGTILDDHHRRVWRGALKAGEHNSLTAYFHLDGFRPGHYVMVVEGLKQPGGPQPIDNYPFHLIKAP